MGSTVYFNGGNHVFSAGDGILYGKERMMRGLVRFFKFRNPLAIPVIICANPSRPQNKVFLVWKYIIHLIFCLTALC